MYVIMLMMYGDTNVTLLTLKLLVLSKYLDNVNGHEIFKSRENNLASFFRLVTLKTKNKTLKQIRNKKAKAKSV